MLRSLEPFRIVSYNVRYFGHALRGLASTRRSRDGIAQGLAQLHPLPHLICLQEVEAKSLRSRAAFRAPSTQTQLESFMDAFAAAFSKSGLPFPFEAFYFPAHAYTLGTTALYTTGLAILVNTAKLKVENDNADAPEHITHHHVVRMKLRKQSRICAHLQLRDSRGRTLHLFNTHLSLPTPFAREFWAVKDKMGFGVNQVEEARKLALFVARLSGKSPFIVCGDFNSPPGSPVYEMLTREAHFTGAQECLKQIDPAESRGFPTAGFLRLRMHLDHLFSGNGISWRDLDGTQPFGEGPFDGLSDHVPLIARFTLPDARGPTR